MYRCRTLWLILFISALSLPLWAAINEEGRDPGDPLDQGGDVCTSATLINTIPYCDTGTTAGYNNDYPVPCIAGTGAPDVVYRITPPVTSVLSFSLCGSSYNTAMTIWQGCPPNGELICCSDNVCGDDACCSGVTLQANVTYFIVIDGGAPPNNSGAYNFNVVQGVLCPTTPCAPDTCPYPSRDLEPINNACGTNVPAIDCGDTLCGEIVGAAAADQDWYRLTVTAPPCFKPIIQVFGNDTPGLFPFGQGLNPYLEVWSADCLTRLTFDDNSGVGNDAFNDSLCLTAGTYFIRVQGVQNTQGPYLVTVACVPCECACPYPNQDVEPNGLCSGGGAVIACGDTTCGEITPLGDNDYYYLRVLGQTCQLVTIDVFGDDTPGWYPFGQGLNPLVALYYGLCDSVVAFDDTSGVGDDARIQVCLEPGTYRLLVRSQQNPFTMGPYILATSCEPCACPDECPYPNRDNEAVNNTCGTFNPPMLCGDTLCGELTAADQVDWYLITVVGPGSIRLKVDVFGNDTPGYYPFGLGLNPFFRVYGAGCTTFLTGDTDSGIGEDAHAEICLTQGTYNIGIASDDGSAGPYILATACEPCDTCPYPNFDVEPLNNTCGTSNEVLHCGDAVCGEITQDPAINDDWYILQLTQCTQLFIDVLGDDTPGFYPFGRGLNTGVELWRADCQQVLYQDQNSGVGEDAQLNTPCLEPGIYMLRVYGENLTEGPYVVFVGCESCTCGPLCEIPCPQNAILEDEPCPSNIDTVNGGCDTNPQRFTRIHCGDVICATSSYSPDYIDADWYRLIILQNRQVRICVTSEFDGYLEIRAEGPSPQDCDIIDLVDCMVVPGCEGVQCLSVCLPPGIYNIMYIPLELTPCADYVIGVDCADCEPAICEAPDSLVISYPDAFDVVDPIANVTLRWPPVATADEYRVYRTSDNNGPFIPSPLTYVATTTDTFFVHESVIQNNGTNEIWIYYVLSYCYYNHEPCFEAPAAVEPKPLRTSIPQE